MVRYTPTCSFVILIFLILICVILFVLPNGSYNRTELILNDARLKIRSGLENYNFSVSAVRRLEDLVPEVGGTPSRVLIVSSWRFGSTFLGDIINSIPGNFYHYEPLWHRRIIQINGLPLSQNAIEIVKSAFRCKYDDSSFNEYFKYKRDHPGHFYHNYRIWEYCKDDINLCLDPVFTGRFCSLFPFQSMKTVRFRLNLAKDILADDDLNIKLVLLIRDPRGVYQSRRHDPFCKPYPICVNPEYLCADLMSDYNAAVDLQREFPGRIKIIRYEELAAEPFETTRHLLSYLQINYGPEVDQYLRTHTNTIDTNKHTTMRKSKETSMKWKKLLNFQEVEKIQMACSGAMKNWGYLPAHNATHLASEDFQPLGNYSLR